MKNILLIFLDGVGIGEEDYEFNPFFKYEFKTFKNIFGEVPSLHKQVLRNSDVILFPTDARLGVDGLPQSGTGQTSIFCGVNAPEIINQHFGPFPYSTLIPIIIEQNIFKYFSDKNKKVFFANAYPKVFFDYLNSGKKRLSVTQWCVKCNEMKFNNVNDVINGNALTPEITNHRWNEKLNYDLPLFDGKVAARKLLNISTENKLTVYEYFLTDHFGHRRIKDEMEFNLKILDDFLFTILTEYNKTTTSIVICSDHGNIENLSIKTHTLNPALTIVASKHCEKFYEEVKDISQIKNGIINILDKEVN